MRKRNQFFSIFIFGIGYLSLANLASAEIPVYTIDIQDHLFYPDEIVIPANTKVKLEFTNHDSTPEEVESPDLNREKVIPAKFKSAFFIGPLPPGIYTFFGEFHPKTAQGKIIIK